MLCLCIELKTKKRKSGAADIAEENESGFESRLSPVDEKSLLDSLNVTAQILVSEHTSWWLVFPKSMLEEIAKRVPMTRQELEDIGMLGKKKIENTKCEGPFLKVTNHYKGKVKVPFKYKEASQKSKHFNKKKRSANDFSGSDADLYNSLVAWRKSRADKDKVRAFHILTNASLEAIVAHRPRPKSLLDLREKIRGIGKVTVQNVGREIIALCAIHTVEPTSRPRGAKRRDPVVKKKSKTKKRKRKKKKDHQDPGDVVDLCVSSESDDENFVARKGNKGACSNAGVVSPYRRKSGSIHPMKLSNR